SGGSYEAHRNSADRLRRRRPGDGRVQLCQARESDRSRPGRSDDGAAEDGSAFADCGHCRGRRRRRVGGNRVKDAGVKTGRIQKDPANQQPATSYGFGPNTSSIVITLMGARLRARTGPSIAFRSPTTATANRAGRMYFWATRCTSAAVTAWMCSTYFVK